jgi:hypothetical protein
MQKQFTSLTPAAFVLPAVMVFSLALYGCQTTQGEVRPDSFFGEGGWESGGGERRARRRDAQDQRSEADDFGR